MVKFGDTHTGNFFFGPTPPHVPPVVPIMLSGDTRRCSARRALKPKFYQPTQTMVTAGILPFREDSHGRAGNRTRDLMISSHRD